ncbi:FAD-dependent oxidoreductase [Nocardioides sp.]|uniref:NAD(P)/FAD-dependent oxidoreductase n=1 Tax=Nocardioides sp. TaxID=35761 RepID=UPI00351784C5
MSSHSPAARRTHHRVVVIGGGTAGIAVAARLRRGGIDGGDLALIEPSDTHYYQPLWTLVGGGLAPVEASARPMGRLIPAGVDWIRDAAASIDPRERVVHLASGAQASYDRLVVAPGIQLNWDELSGMGEAVHSPRASSNYSPTLAPKTWELIRGMREGTAVFTMPANPIKCAGAPQKIAYLAADHWRREGVLDRIRIVMVLPTPGMFGVPVFARELERVVERYGIEVRFNSEAVEFHPDAQEVIVADNAAGTKEALAYDLLHTVPRQSAPDWLRATELAVPDSPTGYVDVDKHTLRHVRFPEVFALGDAGSTPNSKTGAAIRKQAPVVAAHVLDSLAGRDLGAHYDGYASCPLTTARDRLLLAEFDYTLEPHPTLPVIDTLRERRDRGVFKRRLLPAMYWNAMMRGRA